MSECSQASAPDPVEGVGRGWEELFALTYSELRRLAERVRGPGAAATLNPTALVNEAWIKLAGSPPFGPLSPLHFRRLAARAMRQVLVEAVRRRRADKRGGGARPVTWTEGAPFAADDGAEEVLALDRSLCELALRSQRQADVVECRFFGGLEVRDTAELLGVSEATVLRDWRLARAWLTRELRHVD